jgi:hypothetical protein
MQKVDLKLYVATVMMCMLFLINGYAMQNKDGTLEIIVRPPIGDSNVNLYQVIGNLFLAQKPMPISKVESFIKHEKEIQLTNDMKPHYANVIEEENSHLLYALCKNNPYCIKVGLYDRNGIAFALASVTELIGLNNFPKTEEVTGVLDSDLIRAVNDKCYNPVIETKEAKEIGAKISYFYVTYAICKSTARSSTVDLCEETNSKKDIIGYLNYTATEHRPKICF